MKNNPATNMFNRFNARSKLLARLGFKPTEIDELTISAATHYFNEPENEQCTVQECRKGIENYKSLILQKGLTL
jgi:N-acetylglutamate synthase-like GNAT family acetyltransferase